MTPQHGGLVSSARVAWDAVHGVPLKIAVYARGNGSPVLALSATSISFGKVAASVFAISPPKGAHVVNLTGHGGSHRMQPLAFTPTAPAMLIGKARRQVKHLGSGGVLVTYGQGLDGLAVIEKKSDGQSQQPGNGLSLPTVSINGVTAQELPTALGTVVRFTRGGVEYTVLGSQPAATVIAAARAL